MIDNLIRTNKRGSKLIWINNENWLIIFTMREKLTIIQHCAAARWKGNPNAQCQKDAKMIFIHTEITSEYN